MADPWIGSLDGHEEGDGVVETGICGVYRLWSRQERRSEIRSAYLRRESHAGTAERDLVSACGWIAMALSHPFEPPLRYAEIMSFAEAVNGRGGSPRPS